MQGYRIEQGDVLLSVQVILTREEEARGASARSIARVRSHAVPRPVPVQNARSELGSSVAPGLRSAVPTVYRRPLDRVRGQVPPAPKAPIVTVDPSTGAGTLRALRRDLAQDHHGSSGTRVIGVIGIEGLDQVRFVLGPDAAEALLKAIVEVSPFALQPRDRLYRTGRDQLVLLLAHGVEEDLPPATGRLEAAVRRFLTERGYPEVRLRVRALDPARVASAARAG